MASEKLLEPFIILEEGGKDAMSNDPLDRGKLTRCGITYSTFKQYFGDDMDRFMSMTGGSEDWTFIFKKFWDSGLCDSINSQRIANTICDWLWGSGRLNPEMDIQEILIQVFHENIIRDGNFGPHTVDAINEVDEPTLYQDIVDRRFLFLKQIVEKNPDQAHWINGWNNRMNSLIEFNKKF